MNIFQAIVLGIVQGITEFLPISSSAHLVLTPYFFGWQIPEEQIFPFDVLVQLGTLIAVILYFRRDVFRIASAFVRGLIARRPFDEADSRLGWLLILATLPAGVIGILVKDMVEAAFQSVAATAFFLFATAALLVAAEWLGKQRRSFEHVDWKDALWMGFFQALSVFPGISRSGATISGGVFCHLDRPAAARFSFLMSIPVMLAAGLVSAVDLLEIPGLLSFLPVLLAGVITSVIVGYFSIHWLLSFLRKRSLLAFAVYCALLGLVTLLVFYL